MAGQDSNDKIAGLLKQACPPAAASPEFKAKLREQLGQQAGALGAQASQPLWQQPFVWIPVAAALAVAAALIVYFVAFNSTPPAVTTTDATNVTTVSATLNADLTSLGTADNVTVSFEWATDAGGPYKETDERDLGARGTFSADLEGLSPGTTYFYRAKADGDGAPVYGDEKSFTTHTTQPLVTTGQAGNITITSASLNGDLTSLGTADNVTVSFEWGITSGLYTHNTADQATTVTGTFSAELSGLIPGTTYYYRAKADGDGAPVYGDEKSFTTSTTPPLVTTGQAGNITITSASLNGDLSSLGTARSVMVCFEWGVESGSYTQVTAVEARTSTGAFSADLSGLAPDTTYYYRAKADGDGAAVYGEEESFTTPPNLPPVADAGGPYYVDEGSTVIVDGSGVDPEGGVLTYGWDLDNDGVFETSGTTAVFYGIDGPTEVTIALQVCDQFGLCATDTAVVTVANVPPSVGAITIPAGSVLVSVDVNVSANFTDPGVLDTHSAVWDWGDGSTSGGFVDEENGSGSVTGIHAYARRGVYTVTLTVTDKDRDQGSVTAQVTVIPLIVSCDAAGNPRDQFSIGQSVYVKGIGLEPNTKYRIWIQDDPVAEDDILVSSEDPSGLGEGARELVTTDEYGAFGPVEIWAIPTDSSISYYEYDIVVDKQKDGENTGVFNSASDGIDSLAAVGFTIPTPEMTTLMLLGGGLLLLGGWVVLRKRRAAAR